MPWTDWTNPSDVVNNAAVGTVAWTDPGNAVAEDAAVAVALKGGGPAQTNYLYAAGYDWSAIGAGTITGVEARIKRAGTGTFTDAVVRLLISSGVLGDNKASGSGWATPISNLQFANYGGTGDLWGLSPGAITAANLTGFVLSNNMPFGGHEAHVDVMQMRVEYEVAAAPIFVAHPRIVHAIGMRFRGA